MKRSSLSGDQIIFSAGVSDTTRTLFYFDGTSSTFFFINNTGSGYFGRYLSAAFRDISSWYHIIISVDTNQATSSNRIKFYINGVLQTSTAAAGGDMPDVSTFVNNTNAHAIGRNPYDSTGHVNGYLTEINFIDGQALTPSSFGETDAVTGRWKAKAYSGSYGTNGFYLKFADNSSTAALGTDSSGNGNTWTVNNFSVTAGAGNDSLVDSPTNYGSDTGVGGTVRGNYCTLNPLDKTASSDPSDGNLKWNNVASAWRGIRSTIAIPAGFNTYFEITVSAASNNQSFGICSSAASLTSSGLGNGDANAWSINPPNTGTSATKYNNTSGSVTLPFSVSSSDIFMFAIQRTTNKIWVGQNGTWVGTIGISGEIYSNLPSTGDLFAAIVTYNEQPYINFGQRPFAYTAPSGFKALCTTNLSTPTIKKPSSYMDVVTYTGTGASNSISSLGFSPDLVWIKNRGGATSHALYDTTRGTGSQLSSDTTGDEATSSTGLTAFGSNGFTIGTSTLVNTSGTQYVAWAWDEAPIAGMDIVSYTGNGANRTIAHNLGVAPKMMIIKNRTSSADNWAIYHSAIGAGKFLIFSTNSEISSVNIWNNTAPTASVFSVGIADDSNRNNGLFIAYCFAEIEGFSKFGSYTGNGSADGPFVYCGFRPRWVMIKSVMTNTNWIIFDTARSTYNQINDHLGPNTSAAENFQTNESIDATSNGFKIRNINNDINYNTYTHIFAAFAESPFKYARAR